MKEPQVHELLYQALETEIGGQQIYETAISCAQTPELKEEWQKYLEETRNHEQVLLEAFGSLSLDPSKMTPGREIVHHLGESLVTAMKKAQAGDPAAAEIVAAECVVLAETKDHQNWTLISKAGEEAKGELARALRRAAEQVEDQEDEHLYHTMGWSRELWIEAMGMPAVLPPPEEEKSVKTAIGAARAAQSRDELL
ncbi:MAG TPA: hypothetical protein VG845_13610 [Dehalococcoidia bacterium]|nr:hypothetical protein [Dehalococcoidia bacterium]